MTTWAEARHNATRALLDAGLANAEQEACWMVEEASGYDAAELLAIESEPASDRLIGVLETMIVRRVAGEPLQYVLGHWPFRSLDLLVNPAVLIPRPETEVVAEVAITEAAALGADRGPANAWAHDIRFELADLGAGSAAIALALVDELRDVRVWAVEKSVDAFEVASANIAGAGSIGGRVRLVAGSWFDALPEELQGNLTLVVSNPPYVSEAEWRDLDAEVRDHEPYGALVAGDEGTEAVFEIIDAAPRWLTSRGVLVVEVAPHQAQRVCERAREAGFGSVEVVADLAGRDRVVIARRLG